MTARDTYVQNMQIELDKLNERLSALEAKAAHAKLEAREHFEAKLDKLRGHSRDALSKWDELKVSSEASWHQWASDMDRMRDAFVHAFHDFKSRV